MFCLAFFSATSLLFYLSLESKLHFQFSSKSHRAHPRIYFTIKPHISTGPKKLKTKNLKLNKHTVMTLVSIPPRHAVPINLVPFEGEFTRIQHRQTVVKSRLDMCVMRPCRSYVWDPMHSCLISKLALTQCTYSSTRMKTAVYVVIRTCTGCCAAVILTIACQQLFATAGSVQGKLQSAHQRGRSIHV